jgi:hypothetical protein
MNIQAVKTQLNALGFGPLTTTGDLGNTWGPKSAEATKKFQAAKGLPVTGEVDADTLAALFPVSHVTPADKFHLQPLPIIGAVNLAIGAMQIASSQDGVRELTGHNDGPAVETFLASVGLDKGYSWCMSFVYWSFKTAGGILHVPNPLVRTGGCLAQWNQTTCQKITTAPPVPGDIFIYDEGHGNGHTGIVRSVDAANGVMETIEGNTNDNGSSNGDGVYIKKRPLHSSVLKGFIRVV